MTILTAKHLLRCITLKRVWNLIKVYSSYKASTLVRKPIIWGSPYTVTIEPTNRCNLQCPECPSGNGEMARPLGILDFDRYKTIVDELAERTFYLQLFFQGEPFINNRLVDMIRYARRSSIYVAISTNAHFISNGIAAKLMDSKLDKLIVSIDGLSEESYRNYRIGGSLEKVHEALRNLQAMRKKSKSSMEVVLQFLVTKQNEHEIAALHVLAKQYDASVSLKTIQVYSVESAERFLPENEHYRRYRIEGGELITKSKMKNQCVRLWERSVITWDGVVVPCCFDKNADHPLGTIDKKSFHEIWQNGEYSSFRKRILDNRRSVSMCSNCTEGLKVYR